MQERTQVNKKKIVFEYYRQTNQKMMHARKKQFKSFEIAGEEISFQMLLQLALKNITQGVKM